MNEMEWHMDGIRMGYGVTNQVRKTYCMKRGAFWELGTGCSFMKYERMICYDLRYHG